VKNGGNRQVDEKVAPATVDAVGDAYDTTTPVGVEYADVEVVSD